MGKERHGEGGEQQREPVTCACVCVCNNKMGGLVQVIEDKSGFDELVKGDKPVVVDFTATWCGPCKMMAPIFEELSEEYKDKMIFVKVDVDDCDDVAAACGISAMPTFQLYKGGSKVGEVVGSSKDKLVAMIKENL